MADTFTADAGQRIDADGRVTYDFDGHVHARGVDLDAAVDAGLPNDSTVRWVNVNGAAIASIVASQFGAPTNARSVALEANSDGPAWTPGPLTARVSTRDAAGYAQIRTDTQFSGPDAGRSVTAAVFGPGGLKTRLLVNDDGESDLVRAHPTSGRKLMLDGVYTVDSGALNPDDVAFADLTHNRNTFDIYPIVAPLDAGWACDLGWHFTRPNANVMGFAFHNLGVAVARTIAAVFLVTTTQ